MDPLVGPFSVAEGRTLQRETKGYYQKAIITTRVGSAIAEAVLKYKVLSRSQAAHMTGHHAAVEQTVKVLCTLGYLDKLVTAGTPPLYCAGPALRAKFGLRKDDWALPDAFRLAAANQAATRLKAKSVPFGYEVADDASATAYVTLNDRRYVLIAPRIYPGEEDWCHQAVYTYESDSRVIVVAATEEQARAIAEYSFDVGPQVRFAWDAEMRDRVAFYRDEGNRFELEKEY